MVQVNADGVHDTRDDFDTLDGMGVTPGIKIRKYASTRARVCPMRRRQRLRVQGAGVRGVERQV